MKLSIKVFFGCMLIFGWFEYWIFMYDINHNQIDSIEARVLFHSVLIICFTMIAYAAKSIAETLEKN